MTTGTRVTVTRAERDKLREQLRLMERDRDRYERRFGDYSQRLREWQEETGCSHPTAAAEEFRRLREALADADREECCTEYKSRQRAEIERLTADRDACIQFITNEMHWCEFRGEMLRDSASVQNARKLAEFLDRFGAAKAEGGE